MASQEEIEFILDQDRWPNWPWLPVKNREMREDGFPAMGLIFASEPTVVIRANMFEPLEKIDAAEKNVYATTQHLVDAGWVPD